MRRDGGGVTGAELFALPVTTHGVSTNITLSHRPGWAGWGGRHGWHGWNGWPGGRPGGPLATDQIMAEEEELLVGLPD